MTPSFTSLAASSASASADINAGSRHIGPSPADALAAEKVEAIGIEYSYLLTSQLDSQRAYYEESQAKYIRELEETRARLASAETKAEAESRARELQASKSLEDRATKAEARAERSLQLARRFEKDLKEERAVSEGLMETIASLKAKSKIAEADRATLSKDVQDLRDQIRDLMFHFEALNKINEAGEEALGEAAGGSLSIATPEPGPESQRTPKMRKKPKKKS